MSEVVSNESQVSEFELKRLWDLLVLHNGNRIDYNNRKWETIRLSQGAYASLLAAGVAAVIASNKLGIAGDITVKFFVAAIPILMILLAWWGSDNLRRESKLLIIEEYQTFKLAMLIGLNVQVPPGKRYLPNDEWLLPKVWRDYRARISGPDFGGSLEEAAELRAGAHRFANRFDGLTLAEIGLATALFVAVVCL